MRTKIGQSILKTQPPRKRKRRLLRVKSTRKVRSRKKAGGIPFWTSQGNVVHYKRKNQGYERTVYEGVAAILWREEWYDVFRVSTAPGEELTFSYFKGLEREKWPKKSDKWRFDKSYKRKHWLENFFEHKGIKLTETDVYDIGRTQDEKTFYLIGKGCFDLLKKLDSGFLDVLADQASPTISIKDVNKLLNGYRRIM